MAWNRDEHGGTTPQESAGKVRWERIVPGVLRCRLPGWDATVGAVRGTDGVLVVDTGSGAGEGARIRDGLHALLGLPVTHAVLTHPHFDHVFGTAALDGAEVYGAAGLGAHLAGAGGELRDDAVRHGMDGATAAESAARLVAPGHEVSGQVTVALGGGPRVRLVNMGAAHSPFDLAVVVDGTGTGTGSGTGSDDSGSGPGPRVVFCGDLVEESGEPQAGPDASPSRWPGALDRLLALGGEDALYVPGHGAVVGAGFVRAQRDVLARRFAPS